MSQAWFITGTDTGIGKTWCTLALMQYFKNQGLQVAGMKPVAAGCYYTDEGYRNSDAEQILAACDVDVPYDWVNPYAFLPPISPHLAAEQEGEEVSLQRIASAYHMLAAQVDSVVVEGAGGWRVLVNKDQYMKDIVKVINAKVILVVGLRLGCINHALLSAEAIKRDGCELVGWVANSVSPEIAAQNSMETLIELMDVPMLAHMPCLAYQDTRRLARHIEFDLVQPLAELS